MVYFQLLTAVAVATLAYAQTDGLDKDIQTLYERRVESAVAQSGATAELVQSYMSTIQEDGTWKDVNYTTGCDARRANWPASIHWTRILAMSAAYYGAPGAEEYAKSSELRGIISRAMEYWFANDFSTIGNGACLDGGGLAGDLCPCGTPGLWNTNWYSNVILVPRPAGAACLLLRDDLTSTELGNCTQMTARSDAVFYRDILPSYTAGANTLEISSIAIACALLENNRTGNITRLDGVFDRVHRELVTHDEDRVDGVKPDGSFHQHIGIIYNGNYGAVFSGNMAAFEIQSLNTRFQADEASRDVLGLLLEGTQWMVFSDPSREKHFWDYTVIPRFISFAIADNQPSSGLGALDPNYRTLGDAWNQTQIQRFVRDLEPVPTSVNAGPLLGNRMFWDSDYMVHRTEDTITTLKLISNRTKTSECVNTQNPYGFHLSDGVMYQYSTGAEYQDMWATLDWNLAPGSTTDYNVTILDCSKTATFGIDPYAGGVSAGDTGIAAMKYLNPQTQQFSFQKAWLFFSDNVQHVLVNGVVSNTTAPVYSNLDQRLHKGPIYIDDNEVTSGNHSGVSSLWHSGTGYVFPKAQETEIWLNAGEKTGEWKSIGTSTQPAYTTDMFAASIVHDSCNLDSPIEYSIFPATSSNEQFKTKASENTPSTIINDGTVSAAIDSKGHLMGAAFWTEGGGSVPVSAMGLTVHVDRPVVLMIKRVDEQSCEVHLADPAHGSGIVKVRLEKLSKGYRHKHRRNDRRQLGHAAGEFYVGARHHHRSELETTNNDVLLEFELPDGGMAGSGVTKVFNCKWA
ncbi:Polysaccharide lyase family 8, N terminal alpha-helical domain, partial [Rhizoctonia solani]